MQKIEISTVTILKTLLILISLALLFYLRGVLVLLFISLVFMSAFNPWVDKLERGKVPRSLAVLFFYTVFFGAVSLVLASVLPPLTSQTQALLKSLPALTEGIVKDWKLVDLMEEQEVIRIIDGLVQSISDQLVLAPSGIFRLGANIASFIFNLFSFFVVTFYLLVGHQRLKKSLATFLHQEHRERFLKNIEDVEKKLGAWLRGELLLMVIIGLLTYLGLVFLVKIPFALPLAIVAGLLEIVPIVGPIISAIPAIIVAAAFPLPWKILTVVLLYTLIQQLENSLIVPSVMKKAVGLDPLLVLLALIVGGELAGPLGALLAVPVVATLTIVVSEFYPRS